jgi:hypothetical protein
METGVPAFAPPGYLERDRDIGVMWPAGRSYRCHRSRRALWASNGSYRPLESKANHWRAGVEIFGRSKISTSIARWPDWHGTALEDRGHLAGGHLAGG